MVAGWQKKSFLLVVLALLAAGVTSHLLADDEEVGIERTYVKTPDAPRGQSQEDADAKSAGCISCHTKSDAPSMHDNAGSEAPIGWGDRASLEAARLSGP